VEGSTGKGVLLESYGEGLFFIKYPIVTTLVPMQKNKNRDIETIFSTGSVLFPIKK